MLLLGLVRGQRGRQSPPGRSNQNVWILSVGTLAAVQQLYALTCFERDRTCPIIFILLEQPPQFLCKPSEVYSSARTGRFSGSGWTTSTSSVSQPVGG